MLAARVGITVNVAVHVLSASQLLWIVQVTVIDPPAGGTIGLDGNVVIIKLHPPDAVVVASHAANFASISDWD